LIHLDLEGLKNAILNENSDQAWWNNGEMINYEKATKALTGSVFMVLGLSVLNYGTKLETVISNNNELNANASNSSSQSSYLQSSKRNNT